MKQTNNKSTKKGRCYIPKFYDFYLSSLGKENYKFVNDVLYVRPIIRTILNDMKNMVPKGQESLSRHIKEKMDSNSRLLIKNGMLNSKIISISGTEFIRVNCNVKRLENDVLRVMNDSSYKECKMI